MSLSPIDPATVLPSKPRRPLRDEWGIYNPEQAGLQALIRRVFAENDDRDGEPSAERQTPVD